VRRAKTDEQRAEWSSKAKKLNKNAKEVQPPISLEAKGTIAARAGLWHLGDANRAVAADLLDHTAKNTKSFVDCSYDK
jgi:hypothetical protein